MFFFYVSNKINLQLLNIFKAIYQTKFWVFRIRMNKNYQINLKLKNDTNDVFTKQIFIQISRLHFNCKRIKYFVNYFNLHFI